MEQEKAESVASYHSSAVTGGLKGIGADRQSLASGCADRRSLAPSLVLHDFNGKKSKIIQTLKQIDDMRSGVVKTSVFTNLLSCLDVEVDEGDYEECQKKLGLTYQGIQYIKYEIVLRQMHYDNHTEKWAIRSRNDDGDTLSTIAEKTRTLRQSLNP